MTSFITGKTQNAFLELSDAVSNVIYHSQRFARSETTLGSVKSAIEGLAEPVVRLSFLSYFFFFSALSCRPVKFWLNK